MSCLSVLILAVLATCALAGGGADCPEEWSYYEKDNLCIKGFNTRKSFNDARAQCQMVNGDLVQIRDDDKNDFVLGLHKQWFWMGLWDESSLRRWTYVDGSPVTSYQPWRIGEPNNRREQCVLVVAGDRERNKGQWNDGYCPDKLTFVCEAPPPSKCPTGWSYFSGDNTCMKGYNIRKSFNDAREECQQHEADLVQLKDDAKTSFVLGIQKRWFWMGVWDEHRNRQWKYVDGSPVTGYHPWRHGEPNNSGGREQCVLVVAGDTQPNKGQWNDGYCPDKLTFVCEKSSQGAVQPPKICPEGYSRYEGDNTCLRGFRIRKTWANARSFCDLQGGDLAVVKSDDKSKFIASIFRYTYWMGMYDVTHSGSWTFVDGSPLASYHPWARGQPDNWRNREYCIMVQGIGPVGGTWIDVSCDYGTSFVCEI